MHRPKLDGLSFVAALVVAGAVAFVHPLSVGLVASIAVGAMAARGGRRPSRLAVAVGAVAAIVTFARVHRELVRDERDAHWTERYVASPSRCGLRGRVVTMPLRQGSMRADVELEALDCDVGRAPIDPATRVRLYDLPESIVRGDRLDAVVQLAPARRVRDPDLGDRRAVEAARGISLSGGALVVDVVDHARGFAVIVATIDRLRGLLRVGIERSLDPDISPVARALVLGEEDLASDDDEAFRKSGLTHLLAVSGAHVALVVGGVMALFRLVFLRLHRLARSRDVGRIAAAASIPLALVYEQLSGDSGSARRATWMAVVVLSARASGRRANIVRALSLSIIVGVAIEPLAPFDLSFSLSLAATCGLLGLGPSLLEWSAKRASFVPARIRQILAATVAASLACAPSIASLAGQLPVLGVVSNVVAVPIGEIVALPLANAMAGIGAVCTAHPAASCDVVDRVVGQVAGGALRSLRGVARISASPSFASLSIQPPTSLQLAVIVATACVFALHDLTRRRAHATLSVAVAALLLFEGVHLHRSIPHRNLRVTVLDVGQGDSTLVDLPNGASMLIDGGGEVGSAFDPGKAIVAPILRARRRSTIDVVVLSHPHPDHFIGLASAVPTIGVGAFWDSGQGERRGVGGVYADLLAGLRARRVPIVRPEALCGGAHDVGGARVQVLHPCPSFDVDRGPNDNSIVMRISYGARAALLVGDAEGLAEETLLSGDRALLRADFLKVGHHGSRTSSAPAFIDAVAPTVAAISVGARNRFGHPHAATLATFARRSTELHRTDRDGSIQWQTDGSTTSVHVARGIASDWLEGVSPDW